MATSAGRNPDGSENIRYDEPITPELEISLGEADLINAVEQHLQATFGDVSDGQVFHELLSPSTLTFTSYRPTQCSTPGHA